MFLLILCTIIGFFFLKQQWERRKLPPGPFPILFFGNIPQLMIGVFWYGSMVNTMKQWKKTYGDIYTFWLGPEASVFLCTIETSKEVMIAQGVHQVDRNVPYGFRIMQSDENGNPDKGVVFSNGEQWAEHRRFSLTTLRNFGMGRNIMEEKIMEEFDFQFAEIEKGMVDGKCVVKTDEMCDMIVGSIINRFLFGYRFDEETKDRFFAVKHRMDSFVDNFTLIDSAMRPWWQNVPLLKSRHQFTKEPQEIIHKFVRENVQRRKDDIASGGYVLDAENDGNDYMDAYFIEQEKRRNKGEMGTMNDIGLIADLADMWMAGQETTTTTMVWGLHFFLEHPEVVEKCRRELMDVTKGARTISLSDRSSTPYMIATVHEIQRVASIANFNFNRQCSEDTTCMGYRIPKGTPIAAHMSVIMSDEKLFKNPDEFDPSRYLGPNGKEMEQSTIPFGIGKRACLGEGLARAELYLILSNILLRYRISIDPSNPPSGVLSRFKISRRAKQFNIVLQRINQ